MPTFRCTLSQKPAPLEHVWEHTVGSCHAPLALRADWQAQLARCRRELGFQRVRFHGLLCDDAGTLVRHSGKLLYSFFNADRIFDFLLSIGMRPFVELSFMPEALASGRRTVFHYRANVTPPRDWPHWADLIRRLAAHWIDRYGSREVHQWLFEVWNEPNLKAFWTGTQADYFRLYRHTHDALKRVDSSLRVGGPATAKNAWIEEFLEFCRRAGLAADFVSTHHYPTDAFGSELDDTEGQLAAGRRAALREQAQDVRRRAGDRPLYYTEWNSSSNPRDPLHDEPYAAAFAVKTALEASGLIQGYSFWTFSDIFEETYFPSLPFHGGFGLLTLHGFAKPTYRAFELLHRLGTERLLVDGLHPTVDAWVVRGQGSLTVILSNHALPRQPIATERVRVMLTDATRPRRARVERIDEDHANAKRAWLEMGGPEYLSARDVERLHEASRLWKEPQACTFEDGVLRLELSLPPHAVAAVTLEPGLAPGRGDPYAVREQAKGSVGNGRAEDGSRAVRRRAGAAEGSEDAELETLQRSTLAYFLEEANPANGLVRDSTRPGSPCSITAVGLALASYAAGAERSFMERDQAVRRTLATLRFFRDSPHGPESDATGHKGFYYHFLDMETGRRAGRCELSTIDSTFLLAGALAAAAYFDRPSEEEREIRALAEALYRRADWRWAQNGGPTVSHGWRPESGFLRPRWTGYNEALLLYVLGLGSPTHPLPRESYAAWTSSYRWRRIYGIELLHAGPLFIHQLPHVWIDFRGIQDEFMRSKAIDYFENSRRATYVQREYAIRNPRNFRGYGKDAWGLTASDGPGPARRRVDGVRRRFFDYAARGVPFGPDDGTLAPWAVVASLPFAPEIALPAIRHIDETYPEMVSEYGFKCSFNPTFTARSRRSWVSKGYYGLDQGPIVLMIENYRSGLLWRLMRQCPYLVNGLRRAGFRGGWL